MGVPTGTYRLGPESGRLVVKTTRSGLGAKVGHDLTIEATRWYGEATLDPANPANCSVTIEADVDSFKVREGTGGIKPLTDSDRADIEKNLRGKVLHTAQHPTLSFRSTRFDGTAESFRLEGDLTIVGVTQPVTVEGGLTEGRVRGSATIAQTRWGIRPYSAFFGALKLNDEVEVRFDVALTPEQ